MFKKVFFSNEVENSVLKLDVFVEENDIDVKLCYFDTMKIENKGVKQVVFGTVASLNAYEAGKVKEKVYWKEERSTSKKL